jgi:hypothetical protein
MKILRSLALSGVLLHSAAWWFPAGGTVLSGAISI